VGDYALPNKPLHPSDFAGSRALVVPFGVREVCARSGDLDERLRRDLGGGLALDGLLGHAERRRRSKLDSFGGEK
jgi:hypothetical protein